MPLFGKKITISPQLQNFLENIIKNNPSYASLTENKRNDLIQKLAKELTWELVQVLNKNMNEDQIGYYNIYKSSEDAYQYALKQIPDLDQKNKEAMQKFYQKHTKK